MPTTRRDSPHLTVAVLGLLTASLPAQAPADLAALRALVPDAAVLVLESAAPAAAVATLGAGLGGVPDDLPDLARAQLAVGLSLLRLALGDEPAAGADAIAGGGAVFALVPAGGQLRPLLRMRPHDVDAARAFLGRLGERIAGEVHDGVVTIVADAASLAALRAGRAGPMGRWATVDLGVEAPVRGAIDLAAVRALAGRQAPTLAALDGGGRLLFGTLVHALEHGRWLRFSLHGGERLQLRATVDASPRTAPFGELLAAAGERAALPLPADGLASLQLDRRTAALLRTPERWLAPADALSVQSFLSIADALDGVHSSFVDDLVAGLGEPFVLHVLPAPRWEETGPPPPLRLPGFALVAPIVPGAEDVAWRMAQAFALVANAERVQRGEAAFLLRANKHDDGRGLTAELPPWTGPGAPPLDRALTPTLYLRRGHVVLASTTAAADAVLAAIGAVAPTPVGDRLSLHGPALAAWLAAHRGPVELGRMLDEGHGRAEVQRWFDTVAAVLGAVRELSLAIACDAATTTLTLDVVRERGARAPGERAR